MPHIKIHAEDGKPPSILVDGSEVNRMIMAEGFSIDTGDCMEFRPPTVTMVVAADVLDIDMPDAVLSAVRQSEQDSA